MKEKIIILGSGGHAKVLVEIIEQLGIYEIVGVTTNDTTSLEFEGYPILGSDDSVLPIMKKNGILNLALGVGGFKDNKLRSSLFEKYTRMGFLFPSLIHPRSYVSPKAQLGNGVVICAGCNIISGAYLSDNVVVYTGSSIDHETTIGKHVLISAGVTIGAYTVVKEKSLIALGAKVVSGITIGENSIIAAGAVVVADIEDGGEVFGIPGKDRRTIK